MTGHELQGMELADALGVKSAGAGTRFLALLIDLVVWLVTASPAIVGAILFMTRGWSTAALVWCIIGGAASTVFVLVQLLLHGRKGVTVGKALMRLRSVSATTLGRPGFWKIVLRALVLSASGIIPVIGPVVMLASGLWSLKGRSWLDRVAGIWLVDVRQGLLDPFDEKGMRRAKRAAFAPVRDISEHLRPLSTGTGLRSTPASERSAAAIVGISRTAWTDTDSTALGASPAPDAPATAAQYVLVFDDESVIVVQSDGIIGRAPERIAERPDLMLVPLEDPARQLSKSHLAFGVDARGLWIEDLGSSNGTFVTLIDGIEHEIPRSARTDLGVGDRIRIGGRAFQVRTGSDLR